MKLVLITLIVCLLAACAAPPSAEPNVTAIVGATLIDGTESPPILDAVVLVVAGRITAVGPRTEVKIPAGATTIDAVGKTVMPGLIDLHSHYAPDQAIAKREFAAQLAFGVTTARSMGGDTAETMVALADVEFGRAPGPRIYASGLGFTHPGGHPSQFVDFVRQPDTPEQAREGVRELAAQEVDYLKVYVDSNTDWRGEDHPLPKISRKVLEAIIDEASQHGIPVVAHIAAQEDF